MSAAARKRRKPIPKPNDGHKHSLVSFRPPDRIRVVLEEIAAQEERSLSQVVTRLLECHQDLVGRIKRS